MRALSTKSGTPSAVGGGDDRLARRRRRPASGCHLVLEVHADDTDADRPARGLGRVAVAGLEVGGDGEVGRGDDAGHDVEHRVDG